MPAHIFPVPFDEMKMCNEKGREFLFSVCMVSQNSVYCNRMKVLQV